jgi:hypothetical protein
MRRWISMCNPEALGPITLPNRKCPYQTVEEEKQVRQEALEAQVNAWRALLPSILEKFSRIEDPPPPAEHQA